MVQSFKSEKLLWARHTQPNADEMTPILHCQAEWQKYWDTLDAALQELVRDKPLDVNIASNTVRRELAPLVWVPQALQEFRKKPLGYSCDPAATFRKAFQAHERFGLPFDLINFYNYCTSALNCVSHYLRTCASSLAEVTARELCEFVHDARDAVY
ncbi:hypothetical protein LTR86_010418 [Recurvomyces mirabilis]|nr:hypothetical protein LTR86_010418 [Recurvomyces mirabilis]